MSAAPDTRYSDRDVRENPYLRERAEEYVRNYTGEFEYLIDMRMRLASGGMLTTPMIRGILNCMRHDPRVRDLPAPILYDEEDGAEVVPIRASRRRRAQEQKDLPCGAEELHGPHSWRDDMYLCPGRNRPVVVEVPARIKVPYAVARSGRLVHKVSAGGESYFAWYPVYNGFGYYAVNLRVKLRCKFPSWLVDPILVPRPDLPTATTGFGPELCQYCFCQEGM